MKLVQRAHSTGMQTLVRENTALRKSIVSLQRRPTASAMWPPSTSGSEAMSALSALTMSGTASGSDSDSVIHAPDRTGALSLREENERLRKENDAMIQKVSAWKDRWSKLKTTALQKQQRRNSETASAFEGTSS